MADLRAWSLHHPFAVGDQVDETVIADLQAIDHELKRLLLGSQQEASAALLAGAPEVFRTDYGGRCNRMAIAATCQA